MPAHTMAGGHGEALVSLAFLKMGGVWLYGISLHGYLAVSCSSWPMEGGAGLRGG